MAKLKFTGFMGFTHYIVVAINAALWVLDLILDLLFSYTTRHGSLNERLKTESYEYSAQLVDIITWGAPTFALIQPKHYVWKHERYLHPRYVLEHDNITLMGLTPTHAFFCVTDPGVDVRNIKVSVLYTNYNKSLNNLLTQHFRRTHLYQLHNVITQNS